MKSIKFWAPTCNMMGGLWRYVDLILGSQRCNYRRILLFEYDTLRSTCVCAAPTILLLLEAEDANLTCLARTMFTIYVYSMGASSPIFNFQFSTPKLFLVFWGCNTEYCFRYVRRYCAWALPGPRGRARAHGGTGRGLRGDAQAQEGVRRRDHRGAAGGLRGGAPGGKARLVVPGLVVMCGFY